MRSRRRQQNEWEVETYETIQIMDRSGIYMFIFADSLNPGNKLYDELCRYCKQRIGHINEQSG